MKNAYRLFLCLAATVLMVVSSVYAVDDSAPRGGVSARSRKAVPVASVQDGGAKPEVLKSAAEATHAATPAKRRRIIRRIKRKGSVVTVTNYVSFVDGEWREETGDATGTVSAKVEPAPRVEAKPAAVTVTNVVTQTVRKEVPVTVTNVVTQTVRREVPVTVTNVVTQTVRKEVPVTVTNVVTRTDVVMRTNTVVTLTNTVLKTDYLTKTNVVTVKDVVIVTNLVTETRLDAAQRIALERRLAEAEAAREAAESAAAEAKRDAAERLRAADAARLEAQQQLDEVAKRALDERIAREKAEAEARAAEERAAADREAALVWKRQLTPEATAPGGEKNAPAAKKDELTGRPAVITSDRTDYDRKEGVILFDRNVFVDDEQYKMHADRLFVFLDGTNDLKRLVALGRVSITNEARNAVCSRATYHKTTGKIVMYGADGSPARLSDGTKKGAQSQVVGDKITFWLNSEQVQVERSSVSMPGGGKGMDAKGFLKGGL